MRQTRLQAGGRKPGEDEATYEARQSTESHDPKYDVLDQPCYIPTPTDGRRFKNSHGGAYGVLLGGPNQNLTFTKEECTDPKLGTGLPVLLKTRMFTEDQRKKFESEGMEITLNEVSHNCYRICER